MNPRRMIDDVLVEARRELRRMSPARGGLQAAGLPLEPCGICGGGQR